jgi:uncharacterized protein (DUF58 family)
MRSSVDRNRAEALAASLPALVLAARRLAGQLDAGLHGRRRSGQGEQFWQYREAEPGDSLRRIDWRRSARGEILFRREREAETNSVLLIDVDQHPGMGWASAPGLESKQARALVLALACGCLALAGGERVAALGRSAPLAGEDGLTHLAEALMRPRPASVAAAERRDGVLALFGDFLEPPPVLAARLGAVGAGLRGGVLVQVLDPAEVTFAYRGRVLFEDMAAGGADEDVARAEAVAPAFRARMAAQIEAVAQMARAAALTPFLHRTNQSALSALVQIYPALQGMRGAAR